MGSKIQMKQNKSEAEVIEAKIQNDAKNKIQKLNRLKFDLLGN